MTKEQKKDCRCMLKNLTNMELCNADELSLMGSICDDLQLLCKRTDEEIFAECKEIYIQYSKYELVDMLMDFISIDVARDIVEEED